jgi:hypothetical protein
VRESTDTAPGLPGAVQDLARAVSSALAPAEPADVWVPGGADDPLTLAAVRVLGADVLTPTTLRGRRPVVPPASVERACALYEPAPGASPVTVWSHWGLRAALHRTTAPDGADADGWQPDAQWLLPLPWQRMTHHLAQLASLAVPGGTALHEATARRPVDLARGFVRAVRRRDWLQAAGAGRWLALTPGVPESLGLATGLEFVARMGTTDARVTLHTTAAALLLEAAG